MKKRAFTLFELLVSISIIGILIAVASLSYGVAQKKARDARRIEDMNAIQKAAEMYYSQNNYVYPSSTLPFYQGSTAVMQQWPIDPKGSSATVPYRYGTDATFSNYCACARVENVTLGNSVGTNYPCTIVAPSVDTNYYCVKNQQ